MHKHVSKCPQKLASAFEHVLAVACGHKPPDRPYASDSKLEDYAWMNARVLPSNRHISENIVWLWVCTFMIINANDDIARLRGNERQLSKRTILKMAIDLGQYMLVTVEASDIDETDDSLDSTQNIVRRTWICISILAQLHAIGTGTEDPISLSDSKGLALPARCRTLLSEPAASLAGESSCVDHTALQNPSLTVRQLTGEISSVQYPITALHPRISHECIKGRFNQCP